jgi:stage V sporulation protein B
VINAIGAVAVARLVPTEDYGILALSYVVPGFLLLFTDWGINAALTRFLARFHAEGRWWDIKNSVRNGIVFKLGTSLILTLVIFLYSDFLSSTLLRRPELAGLVRFTSVMVILNTLNSACNSIFVGLERMDIIAATMLVQSVVKSSASILLVLNGHGYMGAVEGYMLSLSIVAVIFIFFLVRCLRNIVPQIQHLATGTSLSTMLKFGAPLYLGAFILGIGGRYQSLLLAWVADNATIGNYDVATKFVSLMTMITTPISQTLYPMFSRLKMEDQSGLLRDIFRASVRYSTVVILPSMALMILLSNQMILLLFGSNYFEAPLFFSLMLLKFMGVGVGQLSTVVFLNGQGDTKTTLQLNVVNFILGVSLCTVLAWKMGVAGLLIGIVLSSMGQNIFGLQRLRSKYDISVDLVHVVRVTVSTIFSGLIGYGTLFLIKEAHLLIQLVAGASVFLLSYLIVAPLTGALVHADLRNLRELVNKSPISFPIFDFFIDLWARLFRVRV